MIAVSTVVPTTGKTATETNKKEKQQQVTIETVQTSVHGQFENENISETPLRLCIAVRLLVTACY